MVEIKIKAENAKELRSLFKSGLVGGYVADANGYVADGEGKAGGYVEGDSGKAQKIIEAIKAYVADGEG